MQSIYLDNNATSRILPEVVDTLLACLRDGYVNPASQHAPGRRARRKLEDAREGIAEILGAIPNGPDRDQLIFTSGGTEANNIAIHGFACIKRRSQNLDERLPRPGNSVAEANFGIGTKRRSNRLAGSDASLVVSAIEHPSVLAAAESWQQRGRSIHRIGVDTNGVIDQEAFTDRILETAAVVALMLANNETGVIQPVIEIARRCHQYDVPLHCDAVQAVGKIPLNFRELSVATLSLTAHKFHGPLGIGAILVRHGVELPPLMQGGFQQGGFRPGTESVALAAGMHTALSAWRREVDQRLERMTRLRDRFEALILRELPDTVVLGRATARLPHTSNIALPGIDRQAAAMALDLSGVACATGSACASGSSEPSPAVVAMGLSKAVVAGSLRFSLGADTTAAEIDLAVERILSVYKDLRRQKDGPFSLGSSP